ncbi:putative short-chain dehydrogenase/reductase [Planoprotostelium fungivorum]|uniref:Putative short-chain dehydrogenase/reductase n=1 Tax=Planoprotostelium fungivorum TaxID=1890364 RepID=A0A2P6MXD2_9EUKA|nr:putative short-chain dehydrogenase/reductase [Planoprotostelium fungivorum]
MIDTAAKEETTFLYSLRPLRITRSHVESQNSSRYRTPKNGTRSVPIPRWRKQQHKQEKTNTMCSLQEVRESNDRILQDAPSHLVAVFLGGTSGIGEATLKALANHAIQPRIYLIGRSQEAAERIKAECRTLGPKGYEGRAEIIFIQTDASLIKNLDGISEQIRDKESQINLLVLSCGTLDFSPKLTSEGLPYASTLAYWSRWSFTQNLLPLLNEAARQGPNSISRVVSILSGTCEGPIDEEDIMMLQTARHTSMLAVRARATSLSTLTMEALSKQAPDVSFIHSYPGYVVTPIGNSMPGVLGVVVRCFNATLGRWIAVSSEETGERHVFLATSARYGKGGVSHATPAGATTEGGRVYTIGKEGQEGGEEVMKALRDMREKGIVEKIWKLFHEELNRIRGERKVRPTSSCSHKTWLHTLPSTTSAVTAGPYLLNAAIEGFSTFSQKLNVYQDDSGTVTELMMSPTITDNKIRVVLKYGSYPLNINDHLLIYKHVQSVVRFLADA